MADPVLFTFAEVEFVLRSVAGQDGVTAAAVDALRRRFGLAVDAATDVVVAAGLASLLARGLCREVDGAVVPGELVTAVAAALATRHTVTEVAGWPGERPVVLHLVTGAAVRLVLGPGAYGLFTVEVAAADEPLSAPLIRFLDRCADSPGETAMIVRSSTAVVPDQDPEQLGVAVGRDVGGTWFLSEADVDPDRGGAVGRQEIVDRLVELFGSPVGV